jgi:hypothetical protein
MTFFVQGWVFQPESTLKMPVGILKTHYSDSLVRERPNKRTRQSALSESKTKEKKDSAGNGLDFERFYGNITIWQ